MHRLAVRAGPAFPADQVSDRGLRWVPDAPAPPLTGTGRSGAAPTYDPTGRHAGAEGPAGAGGEAGARSGSARPRERAGARRLTRPATGERLREALADRLPLTLRDGVLRCSTRAVVVLALLGALGLGLGVLHVWRAQPVGEAAPPPEVLASGEPVPGSVTPDTPNTPGTPGTPPEVAPSPAPQAGDGSSTPTVVVVHMAGQVQQPGIVSVPAGSRVADAVAAAGGLSPAADALRLNLARPVTDGEQVLVLAEGEQAPAGWVGAGSEVLAAPATPAPGGGTGGEAAATGGPVDLNSATLADLETLPGVGPVLAQRILDWREANGRFSSIEELREVGGIGEKRFGELATRVGV